MANPRLKINDQEIGLRDLGEGLFEPKSISILQDSIYGIKNEAKNPSFFTERGFARKEPPKYFKIESFCFVVTENIKREAGMMLKSLRKFHDQPVYVICDHGSRKFFVQEELKDDSVFCKIITKEDLAKTNKEIFENHKCIANKVHRPAEILLKMDVMNFALEHHSNTFFLDADIIVLENLQEYFQAKVALSPHYYPKKYTSHGFDNGFYNAGYVFCASRGFPNFWRHLYLNDSIFFEQEGMNRIPERQKIQTFSKEHNVGFWRRNEIPNKIKSLHFHITDGVDKNRCESLKQLNTSIKNVGINIIKEQHPDLYSYYLRMTSPKKIAFVHFGKAAGVYVNKYMKQKCIKGYKKYMSHNKYLNPLSVSNRDWKKDELMKIAETEDEYAYVTNHHINWDIETIKKFKENGWFMFMFLRRPEELLCSLFHWSKEKKVNIRGGEEPNSLEEMFKFSSVDFDPKFAKLWMVPDYIDELDYVSEFNDKNFRAFLLKYFGETYEPRPPSNTSENKGFTHYRENGEISDRAAWALLKHPEYERVINYL
jgi:hypothetical protein